MSVRVGRTWMKGAVYIGRPSVLGNPFVLKSESDRSAVLVRYKEWFDRMLERKPPLFMRALEELEEKARAGNLVLGCFCAPRACHGDVIKNYLDRKIADG